MDPAETREALAHWQFTDPNDRLAHLVKDATKSLLRGLQRRLAEHNVLFGHWAFLRILWEQEGLTQRELNERAGLMEPTTYSALKAMESLGYIERRHLRDNRKNLHIYLTDAGRDLQHKLVPLAEEVNAISTRGLRDDEVATCRKVLLAIVVNMAGDEAAAESAGRRMPSTRELSSWIKEADALRVNER
jgi:DNA-binding MarR family transcriptional regulator